jgi:hypothetical protein
LGPGKADTQLRRAKGPVKQLPASRLAIHRLTSICICRIRIFRRTATAPAPVTARRSGMRSGSGSQVGDDLAEHGHSSGDVLEAGRERKGGMDLGLSELLEWQRTDHVSPVDEVFGLAIVLVAGHIVPSFLAAWRGSQLDRRSPDRLWPVLTFCRLVKAGSLRLLYFPATRLHALAAFDMTLAGS